MWCEKPLALTEDELDAVRDAWLESGRVLAVGFNRRWSPAVLAAQRALAGVAAAQARRLPGRRRAGARWALVPRPAAGRAAARRGVPFRGHRAGAGGRADRGRDRMPGGGPGGAGDDAVVALRFADGSLASIGYGSAPRRPARNGSRSTRARAGSSSTTSGRSPADGKRLWKGRQDKGHRAAATAFRQAVAGGRGPAHREMLATMRATIQAAAGRAA